MLAGERYDPNDPELAEARMVARDRCHAINTSAPREEALRRSSLKELFGIDDRNIVGDGGYTMLEKYINSIE